MFSNKVTLKTEMPAHFNVYSHAFTADVVTEGNVTLLLRIPLSNVSRDAML